MINIAICGVNGRIGRTIYKALLSNQDYKIVFGVDKFGGNDFPFSVFKSFAEVSQNLRPDVIIDFSNASSLDDILKYSLSNACNIVLATTGHSEAQLKQIADASEKIAVFKASNMSLGVNLLCNLAKEATKFLGDSFDVEIVETHHNKKLDSPSGTAITIYEAINSVRALDPVYGRHGKTAARTPSEIGIHAVRGGTVVGKHDVHFFGNGEELTISHISESKEVFAAGALRAASYIFGKKSGLYDMNSIIGDYYAVTNVTGEEGVSLISLENTTPVEFIDLLKLVAQNEINLDMISQTLSANGSASVSFTLSDTDNKLCYDLLKLQNIKFSSTENCAKLTIEGAGMEHKSGVALEVLNLLTSNKTTVYAITTSETKISCCIDAKSLKGSEHLLKEHFMIN